MGIGRRLLKNLWEGGNSKLFELNDIARVLSNRMLNVKQLLHSLSILDSPILHKPILFYAFIFL